MSRPKVPVETQTRVITLSRRRCALCFGLEGDLSVKRGQIAHLDHNPSNNELDNVVFLCLPHHDEYDSPTSQSKGLQLKEVKIYRESLYEAVSQYLEPHVPARPAGEEPSALLTQGEFDFYLGEHQANVAEGVRTLRQIQEVLARHNSQTAERMERTRALLAAPRLNLRAAKQLDQLAGTQMNTFANELVAAGAPLPMVVTKMGNALARASAIASDIELADRGIFEAKLEELKGVHALLLTTISTATGARDATAKYPRASTIFNRGKRLAVGAIDDNIGQLSQCAAAIERAQNDLEKILSLF